MEERENHIARTEAILAAMNWPLSGPRYAQVSEFLQLRDLADKLDRASVKPAPGDAAERLACARGSLQVALAAIKKGEATIAIGFIQAGLDIIDHGIEGCARMRGDAT